jgi:outer membrane protein
MLNKKTVLAGLIATSLTLPVYADVLGATVGVQAWQSTATGGFANNSSFNDSSFEEQSTTSLYAKFEHPIPLIPNIRFRMGSLDSGNSNSGTNLDFSNTDITLYWELLDNDLVGFDFGVTAKYLSGDYKSATGNGDASLWLPMAYVGAKVAVPLTGAFIYGDINLASYDDNSVHDYEVGVGYNFVDNLLVDIAITAGYREVSLELDDVDGLYTDIQFDGYFVGLEVHF